MKKPIRSIGACALLLVSSVIAEATTYTATNVHGVFLTQDASQTGSFDISPPYNYTTEKIDSASVTFTFVDDVLGDLIWQGWFKPLGQEAEAGTISLDGEVIGSESGTLWIFASFTYGVVGDILMSFSETGVLNYEVKSTQGDFWFKTATVCAQSSPRAVPDGGMTVVLLGASLLGLATVRSRVLKK